jgi:hypothetical protein
MSAYFRKSFKVAPGVHINLSKRGTGVSFGVRGAHVSLSPTGRITKTASIPGTGIYYRDVSTKSSRAAAKSSSADYEAPETPSQALQNQPLAHQVVAVEHHGFYISHGFAFFASIVAAGSIAQAQHGRPLSPWVPVLLALAGLFFILWLRDLIHSSNKGTNSHE